MNFYVERASALAGFLLIGWALVAAGFHWALWAVRTGRVDLAELNRKLKG